MKTLKVSSFFVVDLYISSSINRKKIRQLQCIFTFIFGIYVRWSIILQHKNSKCIIYSTCTIVKNIYVRCIHPHSRMKHFIFFSLAFSFGAYKWTRKMQQLWNLRPCDFFDLIRAKPDGRRQREKKKIIHDSLKQFNDKLGRLGNIWFFVI